MLVAIYSSMSWNHLIRFTATEDDQVHFGQLVNTDRDIGQDILDGIEVLAYRIDGTCFSGKVTSQILRVRKVNNMCFHIEISMTNC